MAINRVLKFNLPLILAVAALSLLIVIAIIDRAGDRYSGRTADRCLVCHSDVRDMSASHPNKALGCSGCHLGNPYVSDREIAHQGMVKNPSDLRIVKKTCGKSECHPVWAERVTHSIMSTNAGIVASTLYQWDERNTPDDSLAHIGVGLPDTSLATSHLRKMCAGCHINKPQNDLPGEFGERGGGCNDCHLVNNDSARHPVLTVQMKINVCEKCHNRSDRTGLTYQGKFESEGYGTPYEQGNFSERNLSGGRFYYHIPADVHFEAGMVCIDCHPAQDLMGDGRRYQHLEEQVHIRCETCHQAKLSKPAKEAMVWKIVQSNPALQAPKDSLLAVTANGVFLANVYRRSDKIVLRRKSDGRELGIVQTHSKAACNLAGHERLSCQGCHSAYTPQCYGCHDVYDPNKKQQDKISYKETRGHWSEGRSYLRFEKPTLGVDARNRIMPFAPGCQVYLTVLDEKGKAEKQETWLTMAPFDPHSTRKRVPQCADCHSSAKRLGLGEGQLFLTNGALETQPIYDAVSAGLGKFPLEQMTTLDGRLTQKMSRLKARPFNPTEIKRIYRVILCLTCHDSYKDSIYRNFARSVQRYKTNPRLPCKQ